MREAKRQVTVKACGSRDGGNRAERNPLRCHDGRSGVFMQNRGNQQCSTPYLSKGIHAWAWELGVPQYDVASMFAHDKRGPGRARLATAVVDRYISTYRVVDSGFWIMHRGTRPDLAADQPVRAGVKSVPRALSWDPSVMACAKLHMVHGYPLCSRICWWFQDCRLARPMEMAISPIECTSVVWMANNHQLKKKNKSSLTNLAHLGSCSCWVLAALLGCSTWAGA